MKTQTTKRARRELLMQVLARESIAKRYYWPTRQRLAPRQHIEERKKENWGHDSREATKAKKTTTQDTKKPEHRWERLRRHMENSEGRNRGHQKESLQSRTNSGK